eukprot:TRINITY_DN53374_c0_g1_i2.p7 TRINITY_DN53374_c0_g1~~TRINITY_DN53374_c0_g1_i2.p7  ORF type:complete len:103 (+),score=8.50 TRINITY_DN53374_c0_g1_i2:811-1119(+)
MISKNIDLELISKKSSNFAGGNYFISQKVKKMMLRAEFSTKCKSKKEIYKILVCEGSFKTFFFLQQKTKTIGRFLLPPLKDCTMQFFSQALLANGTKSVRNL